MHLSEANKQLTLTTKPACPICAQPSARAFQKNDYWIYACAKCRHQFVAIDSVITHAEMVYNDDYFAGGGAGYPDYLAESGLIRAHGRRYGRLLKQFIAPGQVLDIGAAAGFMLQGFLAENWTGAGLEPNDRMASYARDRLGLAVQTGTLEQLTASDRFDLVSMIQVLPHFYDLRLALERAATATKPGGYWLIETWNRDSLTAKLFGKNWHEYSPPSVLHWFTPASVQKLTAQYGFHPVAQGRPAKWINGAHVKSLLSYKLKAGRFSHWFLPLLQLIPDHLALPYPAEDLFWILLKQEEKHD